MEQEVKHLKYFKVENFKCFESFEMEDIGKFNLIVGDNNVGKTNLLEALLFKKALSDFLFAFQYSYLNRNHLDNPNVNLFNLGNIFEIMFRNQDLNRPIKFSFDLGNANQQFELSIKQKKNLGEEEIQKMNMNLFISHNGKSSNNYFIIRDLKKNEIIEIETIESIGPPSSNYIPIILTQVLYRDDLVSYFSDFTASKINESKILSLLQVFSKEIASIKISNRFIPDKSVIAVTTSNSPIDMPLSQFGDGIIKFFRICLEIALNPGSRLLIDEVENGIHHSRFKDYWKNILQVAKENKVQLFMTTHSLECLKYFKEALEELGEEFQKEARLFSLVKVKEGDIKSFTFNYDQFSNNVELENEMRD